MNTAMLGLPLIAASQAQKHLTHNEALRALDAVVQATAASRSRSAPPATPSEGECFIVAAPAAGAWIGHGNALAAFQDGAWMFYGPRKGWRVWVADEAKLRVFDGSAWVVAGGGENVNRLGIGAAADDTNRLAVASPASLFTHAGNGHQLKINKAASADTASLLFQTDYSGRAEIGLAGGSDLTVKTSADAVTWRSALTASAATGKVGFPQGLTAPLALADGGTGAATASAALGNLGLRYSFPAIADDAVVQIDFGAAVAGALILLVANTPGLPSGVLFARMAASPQLAPIAFANGSPGAFTTPLTGTGGPDNQVNLAALDSGRLQIENRRGGVVGYTVFVLR